MCGRRLKAKQSTAKRVKEGVTFVCCELCANAYVPFWATEVINDAVIVDVRHGRCHDVDHDRDALN